MSSKSLSLQSPFQLKNIKQSQSMSSDTKALSSSNDSSIEIVN